MTQWERPRIQVNDVVGVDKPAVTLIEFLRARLDEDEVTANEAAQHGERVFDSPLQARFWSPRVLAEVEAKRRTIEMCEGALAVKRDVTDDWPAAAALAEDILDEMATPYADHPDYDKDWCA